MKVIEHLSIAERVAFYLAFEAAKRPLARLEALALVPAVTAKANELDPRAAWYSFGTARLPDDDSVPIRFGSLNRFLNLPTRREVNV